MPARLIQYALPDGQIRGFWEGHAALLQAQTVPDDPAYGYLEVPAEEPGAAIPPGDLLRQWYVEDGMLTAKVELTLTAAPAPFPADGTTVCQVTVSPFVPCTVLVDSTAMTLTATDPTGELTSDVPERFVLSLASMPTHWAEPIIVEAV